MVEGADVSDCDSVCIAAQRIGLYFQCLARIENGVVFDLGASIFFELPRLLVGGAPAMFALLDWSHRFALHIENQTTKLS
jgi:hypothetical protein